MSTEPLSRAQRGLWFLDRLRPGSPAYNLSTAARVHGDLPAAEIRAFFQAMVDRHAVLRSTFRAEGEEPVQVVHERAELAFEEIDAETWSDAELRAGVEEAAWQPFDLERGPVFRLALFRQGAERVLVVAMHHIVADFGALGLFSTGEEGAKEYADFVTWQADLLAGAEGERLWTWWRERLASLPELDLPADRVRPERVENVPDRGGARRREIGPETLVPLKALARSRRATLYVTLLAAFQALLHRYTGQEDFAVGSPAAGRPKGFARTFGYFTSPLVQRADLAGDPSFRKLVDRTRQSVADALDHQHFPLSLLTERLRPGEELFRAMFVLHQGPDALVSLVLGEDGGGQRLPLAPGFELESLPLAPRAAQFDVTLAAGERRGKLGLELIYDAARFDAPTAARWLEHFAHLLAGAVEAPDTPVSALPLLSPGERHQVLVELNDSSAADLPWSTLQEGFEHQAEANPHAVALIDQDRSLTYQELNARASELAARLRQMGIGPETVVGVRLPRTADLIVSLLGVLKAGGAYVPLDPSYPEERTAFMVADAGAAVLIEPSPPAPLPQAGEGRKAFEIKVFAVHPSPACGRGAGGEGSLAYLIYTSGSTGRPKGVAIEHAAAVRLVAWAGQAFSPAELRGVLAATSVSFDLSIFEIFVPLSFGGTVILAENALALPSLPARDEVTLINTVPSALAGLLELGGLPASVRTVNLAGEPLRRALAERILATGVKLWDLYGPSEDTTYSTGSVVEIGDPAEPAIGWPVAGSQAYVLDRTLRPLPLGIPGELCLGGGGLARGYLGRPELTAEKLIPDPFSGRPGARLYRTGDLVRRRSDGALDYLGRIDHQVKIRGFRIELGEVEAALLAVPWVREAVVVARDGTLAAYVALAGEIPAGPEEALREALRERLPAPFVPSFFVVLDALPRTPNGKVDRKALPAPAQTGASGSAAPVGIVEETLAAIWADLLGRTEIGRQDRFFDLGGHSLLATRALARVREAWGAEIPLGAFFEEPTLTGLARRIETARHDAFSVPIPRAPRDLPLPLSFAQQRFWFLDRLEPGQATYNVPLSLRFQGPLDPATLAGALREMVRRHEALRTTFAAGEDGPVQRIGPPPVSFLLPCADLEALTPGAAAVEERRLERAEARRPFDLEHGPLVRALLMRRSPEEHRLILTLHHIACDGWSLGLLLADMASFLAGGEPAPEPPLQYADFAAWQRREPIPEPLFAAWHERLAGAPALELPADRPDPSRRGALGATLVRLLPSDLAAGLAAAARGQGTTLFMALLAGFDALLHRHTGQTDLVVGTVVAGRSRVELERVVGCFVNTLALRVDLDGSWTFGRLLDEARSVALAAFLEQDLPFERLVEEIHPHRDAARRPFPRALVVLQNEPLAPPVLPGLAIEIEPVDTGTARSDLALAFHEAAEGLLTTVELRKDVFDDATVARLWDRFGVLLAAAAADPLVPLAELPLLTEAERQELAAWGRARIAADPDAPTAVRLFEGRASQTPEAPALVDGERTLTFGELDRAANRLAGRLRVRGVGPGRIVGLSIERSAEMVIGLLGIWKAGGASLPLDPALPEARRAFLIGDALGDEPIVVTRVAEEGGDERGVEPASGPRDPAYVIYTSGTTGAPKGVVVEHGQLAALLGSVQSAFGFQADDRMPCVAPFSFDIFFFELLAPLLAGGTSVLVGLRPSLDVDRLVEQLGEMTRLHAVPALLRQICDAARASGPWPGMRSLFVGGDRVPADLLDDLRPVFPNADIHVLYGPTEATILATSHQARPGEVGSPIGRPLDHVDIVVADAAGRPVPAGVPGEIRIGGAGVARGYLNRPELNEEKFPIVAGRRMYRSGDLARWRPDGVLEFLGRVDEQVKVRGFRIEPGEVEAAIVSQPGARAAAVIALDGRLVAFVVPEREESVAVGDLQEALRARLPDYMVPGSWHLLSELPLTSHGKVDRRALATLGAAVPEEGSGTAAEAPRGPVEETIAAIFAEVLGRERVGRRESFFDLGGHSLLATRVASRVRSALGAEIPLVAVFDSPTVEGVAAAVDAARGRPVLPPLERTVPMAGGAGEAPLSFAQQRLWFLDRLEPGGATYNLPVAVRLRGALDVAVLEQALRRIVHRHEALRSTFHEGKHGPFQRIETETPFTLPSEDLSAWGEEAEAVALRRMAEEAVHPFDLERGPIFRAHLLRIAPGDHLLVANLHHIVSDGWSMSVLVRELSALYRGLPMPELPVQYADWARWQRGWLVGDVLETQLGWWREALRGLPERLDLPTDHPRRSVERRSGARRPVRFGPELTRELATLSRRESATLFIIVLAGFQALLGRRAGQDDLAVGSPVAGRTQTEVEGLIGFFANTLVLRSKLYGNPDGHELLRRTRAKVLAAYEHQHVPFEKLVEELAPARQLGRTPLFEAMIAFQNGAPEPPDLPEVAAELLPVETGTAKFDLLLDLTERDGGLSGSLEYDADLFEAVTIDRLLTELAALLRGLAATPGERISNILLLAGIEGIQMTASHRSDRGVAEPAMFESPRGPIEEGLAGIWTELLGREGIGRWDSFFDRGGHSLLAAQVVSRVRRAFGVEIPLRTLFEEPILAGLAERIGIAAEEGSAASLAGAAGEGPAPLSFAQQRLWFLAQLDAASPAYNLPAAVRLRGSLDVAALERALAGLVRRHESLRTRFPLAGGEPAQVVEDSAVFCLPCADLRPLGTRVDAEARRLAAEEGARPFDLQNGPVVRALLLRLADREHQLIVTMHHIVSDGWSLGVFIRELTALHAGLPLPALPVRYRDFAVWQRTRLSGETLERSLAFWRSELDGLPPGLDLPTDRPRPPVQTSHGAVRPFALDAATTSRLRGLARAEGATLFMVLLAVFQALLARWSGQEDLAVGTPIAGRTRIELEGLIGFFVNTLVLRGDLSNDPELRTLVDRTRERFLAAQAHQELPFEKLVEELRPERNLARSPFFQVLLVLQNAPRAPLALPGLAVASEAVETGTAKFEIQLTLEEADGGLTGSLDFNRDLFDAATMDRLLGHYAALLAEAGADPGRRAGDLPILSRAESQQLQEWNATAVAWPAETTLPALFAAQADRTPDRIAVRFEGESLTYRELDARSSRLAWRLRRLGVGPDVVVAVALERSLELIVSLYAVHKAGGAYLPLDRSHPDDRLSQMLADSGAPVVLTLALDRDRFADRAAVVCLDAEAEALAAESAVRPPLEITGDHLAYVIFTSGSTGAPKGAMNTHAAISNRILWMQAAYRLGERDRVLQKTPYTFDVSVWEFFWPLVVGARLVVARPEGHRDPSYLLRTLIEEGITVLHFVPSMLQVFLGEPGIERAGGVRQVMASGEALPADLARRFFEHLPAARLHNLYGPTEAAVDVTAWICAPGSPEPVVPIGRPIANLEIRILDRLARPVPVGAPGELCIGGIGLARGYLSQPRLTADRFVPDPQALRPGERLYRTGDLARWRIDGHLEYLGRLDHQVKIRGMRIEPGEIEAVLDTFPAVREAAVLAREDRPGDRRLVAYLVAESELSLENLRMFLRDRLPEPLVPAAFVVLDAFPVTANGKLDRKALPPPADAQSTAAVVLPRTAAEEAVATVWREVLGLETVGVEDSFFDLGGHSLLVVQVHRRLIPQFPGLAIVDLFRYPTISALSGYLSKEKVDQISLEETRERAEDRTDRARRQRELRRQARGR